MMDSLANSIIAIIGDYRNEDGVFLTKDDVLEWVSQFENADRIFILEELLHLLNQGIYLSKEKAKLKLYQNLQELAKHFKYSRISDFLRNCHFLDLQADDKSQKHILKLMDDLLIEKYNFSIQDCGTVAHKHFIYLDDVVGTGNTVHKHLAKWLKTVNHEGVPFYSLYTEGKINIIVSTFCYHTWGWANVEYRLSKEFISSRFIDGIVMQYYFRIENNVNFTTVQLSIEQNQLFQRIVSSFLFINFRECLI
jgi:hypothetical protein